MWPAFTKELWMDFDEIWTVTWEWQNKSLTFVHTNISLHTIVQWGLLAAGWRQSKELMSTTRTPTWIIAKQPVGMSGSCCFCWCACHQPTQLYQISAKHKGLIRTHKNIHIGIQTDTNVGGEEGIRILYSKCFSGLTCNLPFTSEEPNQL